MKSGVDYVRLKRMFTYLNKYRYVYLLGLFGKAFAPAFYNIVAAFAVKYIVNAATYRSITMLQKGIIIFLVALLTNCIVTSFSQYYLSKSVKSTIFDIRIMLISHIQRLPKKFYEKYHSGQMISRVTNDIQSMQKAYDDDAFVLIYSLIYCIGAAISMVLLDLRLAFFIILLAFSAMWVNKVMAKSMQILSKKFQEENGLLVQYLVDVFAGLRTIKAFGIGNIIVKKFIDQNKKCSSLLVEREKKNALINGVNYLIGMLSYIGLFIIAAIMAFSGFTNFGTVSAVLSLQMGITFNFLRIGSLFSSLQSSLAGAERVFEIFDQELEPERYNVSGKSTENQIITMKNIIFSYNEQETVINGLSLSINKGEKIALVGTSGSGKTTIFRVLMGFYPPDSGEISINEKPLSYYTLKELRDEISYVSQDTYLFDGTIEENIRYGNLLASKQDVIDAAKNAYAHSFIMEMPDGYNTSVGEKGSRLSGGQKQRIAIARAFVKNAPILLLDEATSSLDSESEELVQKALKKLEEGRTVLTIAHRLSSIELVDRIFVIENGRIVETGSHNELIVKDGYYSRLYNVQFLSNPKLMTHVYA